jgi:hypothetical protein
MQWFRTLVTPLPNKVQGRVYTDGSGGRGNSQPVCGIKVKDGNGITHALSRVARQINCQ